MVDMHRDEGYRPRRPCRSVSDVSKRTHETDGHRHSATHPKRRGRPEEIYLPNFQQLQSSDRDTLPSAMDEPSASNIKIPSGAKLLQNEPDLEQSNGIQSDTPSLLVRSPERGDSPASAAIMPPKVQPEDDENSGEMESLPDLDEGYQTSEGGFSIAEELVSRYLKAFRLDTDLPHDVVESSQDPRMNHYSSQSRFSWGSSIDAQSISDLPSQRDVWWKPIEPLDIKPRDQEMPPPIPARNPLRLLRRDCSKAPGGFASTTRGPRNIHNLYIDSCRANTKNAGSVIDSKSAQDPPSMCAGGAASKALSGDPDRETRLSAKERKLRRSQSTKEVLRWMRDVDDTSSKYTHSRVRSDPLGGRVHSSYSLRKWDTAMPSQLCKRISCITGTKKDDHSRVSPRLDLNKQLPPLPSAST